MKKFVYIEDGKHKAEPLEDTYTGTAERTVGGISESDVFTDATMTEMWDSLILQEKYPSLSNPSSNFSSTATGYKEIGLLISSIQFTSTFNRGSINPQYDATSPYRSGDPNEYNYAGTGLTTIAKVDLSDTQTITNYTVVANGQTWTNSVDYDGGVQPTSSYGNPYNSPLAAGRTGTDSRSITGVLPVYATNNTITVMNKEPLQSNGSMIQVDFVAEDGVNKQTTDFPSDVVMTWGDIVRIDFYDTASSSWKTISGSNEASVATFDITLVTHTVQGTSRDYARYTHNGPTTGARQTRWYTN
jgi:hypothetical protein